MCYVKIEIKFSEKDLRKKRFCEAFATPGINVAEEYLSYRLRKKVQPRQDLHKVVEVQT